VPAVTAVVVATVVITDLPQSAPRAAQISSGTAVMSEVKQDIGPCSFAVSETFTIYGDMSRHLLTPAQQSQVPGLLTDDQSACSFTSQNIYDLSTITVAGTASGKYLGQLVGTLTLWATADALAAIEQVQVLEYHPHDAKALRALAAAERSLDQDRASALNEMAGADGVLHMQLPSVPLAQAPSTPA
jgi:hypothetical protein